MLRPDLKYNDKINIKLIFKNINKEHLLIFLNINKEHLLIPNFGWNGSILNGNEKMLNDRFVFGTFESIKKYSNRINYIELYFKKYNKSLHSESFVYFVVTYFKIKYELMKLNAQRIRSIIFFLIFFFFFFFNF